MKILLEIIIFVIKVVSFGTADLIISEIILMIFVLCFENKIRFGFKRNYLLNLEL